MTSGAAATPLHVMLDIETLGNGNKAVLFAIGATKFSLEKGSSFETQNFYVTINPQSCIDAGLEMDLSTILWWMKPEQNAARDELVRSGTEGLDLATALDGFARWVPGKENLRGVWGNGATFDNVIVRNAYKAVGLNCPWSFREDRCFRTVKNLYPHVEWDPSEGTVHNALDDAVSQTRHLKKMLGV